MPENPSSEIMTVAAQVEIAVKRADCGDQNALLATRRLFDMLPNLWDAYGNLADAAERALVDLYAGQSVLTGEALRKRLAEMRVELEGPQASPLEKLLVERVVACWLQSYHADYAYARALKELPSKEVEFYQRRQDRAARQYLKALRSLADVRRLLVPALQVNIADRQVNIAGLEGASLAAPGRVRRAAGRRREVANGVDALEALTEDLGGEGLTVVDR